MAEAERARLAQELGEELRKKNDELAVTRNAIAALERENAETKSAQDGVTRQRDELARRIARITGEQKRLLDDLADPATIDPGQRSVRSVPAKQHVVELSQADILPPQRDRAINLPPPRPVPVAPPKVRTL